MDIEKNIKKWQDFLNNPDLSAEDRMILETGSIDQVLEIARRQGAENPFSLIRAREDYLASREAEPTREEVQDKEPEQAERGSGHRRSQHFHPIHEETEEEAEQVPSTVVKPEQKSSPATVTQARIGGYPNRRRGGFLNRTNRIAARAARARRPRPSAAKTLAKGARVVIGGGVGLVPKIAVLVIALIFFIVVIIILIAGCSIVNNPIGDFLRLNYCKAQTAPPPGPEPGPEPGPRPQCETNDFIKCLKDDFNMIIVGTPGRERVEDLYDILSELGVSGTYKSLLKSSGPTYVFFINGDTTCAARVRNFLGYTYMTFEDFGPGYCSKTTRKDRITHETGHVIKGGHARLFQQYESEAYWPKDSDCYYYQYDNDFVSPYHFIKTYDTTYAKENHIPISGSNESMADSMALYVRPESPLGNFPSQCPRGYNWIKTNIFGGTPL